MTSRARTMLDALEAHGGTATRSQLWNHASRFYLTNNSSAELRAAGVEVEYDRETDSYRLLDERETSTGANPPPGAPELLPLVEQDGQFAIEVTA